MLAGEHAMMSWDHFDRWLWYILRDAFSPFYFAYDIRKCMLIVHVHK